ncbi:MAG TPA: efflux RND transporter periplasmic adaptor subunit [Sphingomicrobium sp.]|nr:efflux RND transporter periplasmic adaptor subunit [Sphingomicrobium sp.]
MKYRSAIAACALLLAGCGGSSVPQPTAARPARGEHLTVEAVSVTQLKPLAGEITTRKQAEALARIAGILVQLSVREGDQVTKGELIGRVVETRLGFLTNAFDAQIAAASAEAENAQAELHRVQYLYDRGVYAKARLDQAQASARAAQAQVEAARSQRSASAALAAEGAVLAPEAGRVLRADVPQGSAVTEGMSLATITAGPPILRLDVPQSLVQQLHVGAAVTINDEPDLNGRRGTVVQVYPAVAGGRVRADVDVPGLDATFVGRRVSALLDIGSRRGIMLPRRFISTRFGIDYVRLVGKDGSANWSPVQTAPTGDPRQLEILSGVSPGDVLVTASPPQ